MDSFFFPFISHFLLVHAKSGCHVQNLACCNRDSGHHTRFSDVCVCVCVCVLHQCCQMGVDLFPISFMAACHIPLSLCSWSRDRALVQDRDLNRDCVHDHPNATSGPAYYTQCFYEAFVSKHVFHRLGLDSMRFLLPPVLWKYAAPTWNDSSYRHIVMQVSAHVATFLVSS